jgi:hypothetical protein
MRQAIYDYIGGLDLGSFKLATNLPFIKNGTRLHFSNKKHIYVDTDQQYQSPGIDTFGLTATVDEVVLVPVYLVCDAKQLPADYDAVVARVQGARLAPGTEDYIQRTVKTTSSYVEDDLVTTWEFSFKRIIPN